MPVDLALGAVAPDSFLVRFETTKGSFTVKAHRAWSPLGVDRFYHLVQGGYFDDVVIYRVGGTATVKGGFVAQFGLTNNPKVNAAWEKAGIPDEPVLHSNLRGTVLFARDGPDSRSNQLAFNLTDNAPLDTVNANGVVGFPPIAEVTEGVEVWDLFNKTWGNKPLAQYDSIAVNGKAFLDRNFPGLDRILRVTVVK